MNRSREQVLMQADTANSGNRAYKPDSAYAGAAAELASDGYLERRGTGGFDLSDKGRRELAAIRGRKVRA